MSDELQSRLGHQFRQPDLLTVALTHRSYHFENKTDSKGNFERLEFLGDAVLDLLVSEHLMHAFPGVDEGTLSKWRASLVNEAALSQIAKSWDLAKHLYLGRSEEAQRDNARPRLLASALEAVIAAIYLDAGLEAARALVLRELGESISRLDAQLEYASDFKTRLQEWSQKRYHSTPEYRLISSEGPEHAKVFHVEVFVQGQLMGKGEGGSRKGAEQEAARSALQNIGGVQK